MHTVALRIWIQEGEPLSGATVSLGTAKKEAFNTQTNKKGEATFTKVKAGIYFATVKQNGKEVAKTVLNVKGANELVSLSINLANQKNNPLLKPTTITIMGISIWVLGGILVGGIAFGILIAIIVLKIMQRKHSVKKD